MMNHIVHRHPMLLWSTHQRYTCSSCREDGFRQFYHCADCNLHFHDSCATAMPHAVHPLNENCILDFRETTTLFRSCDACGTSIAGSRYRYKDGGLLSTAASINFHPRCVGLPAVISGEGVQLRLVDIGWSKTLPDLKCQICSRRCFSGGKGWSYVSPCGELAFHVACVKGLIQKSWNNNININNSNNCYYYKGEPSSSSPVNQIGQSYGGRLAAKFMVKVGLKLVLSACLGDPTMSLAHFIVEAVF